MIDDLPVSPSDQITIAMSPTTEAQDPPLQGKSQQREGCRNVPHPPSPQMVIEIVSAIAWSAHDRCAAPRDVSGERSRVGEMLRSRSEWGNARKVRKWRNIRRKRKGRRGEIEVEMSREYEEEEKRREHYFPNFPPYTLHTAGDLNRLSIIDALSNFIHKHTLELYTP